MGNNFYRRSSKPRANKITVNGITFASETEYEVFKYLSAKLDNGEIRDLTLQPKFILRPKRKLTMVNKLVGWDACSAIEYTADMQFFNFSNNRWVVCEAKGHADVAFKIRARMFLDMHIEEYDYLLITAKWKPATKSNPRHLVRLDEHWYYPYIEQPKLRKKK